jgi:DNA-binding MarR family transcriptional regulator
MKEELYALLCFIYEQNQKNLQVSLKKIRQEFSLSYPTVKRRYKALEENGLICSRKSGRSTTLHLSEKGKALLLKTSILSKCVPAPPVTDWWHARLTDVSLDGHALV